MTIWLDLTAAAWSLSTNPAGIQAFLERVKAIEQTSFAPAFELTSLFDRQRLRSISFEQRTQVSSRVERLEDRSEELLDPGPRLAERIAVFHSGRHEPGDESGRGGQEQHADDGEPSFQRN